MSCLRLLAIAHPLERMTKVASAQLLVWSGGRGTMPASASMPEALMQCTAALLGLPRATQSRSADPTEGLYLVRTSAGARWGFSVARRPYACAASGQRVRKVSCVDRLN